MAELQTIAAVCDLIKVAYAASVFLKKVKDADSLALGLWEQIQRLRAVLKGVEQVLIQQSGLQTRWLLESDGDHDETIVASMLVAVEGSKTFLLTMEKDVGGFQAGEVSGEFIRNMVRRLKIAWQHPKIAGQRAVLEAQISTLQTGLAVLHLVNEARIQSTIDANHTTLLQRLEQLESQIREKNTTRAGLARKRAGPAVIAPNDTDSFDQDTEVEAAVANLSSCLRTAEEVHEVYTEYTSCATPDHRSIRYHERVISDLDSLSSGFAASLMTNPERENSMVNHNIPDILRVGEDLDEPWPCELLDQYIVDYIDRAQSAKQAEHYNQAENNLHQAIQVSELRERHYEVLFTDRVKLQEEIAVLYVKQGKWAGAAAMILNLVNSGVGDDRDAELILARQHQLLGWTYFEWYSSEVVDASSGNVEYLGSALRYARLAFNKRYALLKSGDFPETSELVVEHESCMNLLISIFEQSGMTVEANDMKRRLSHVPLSSAESLRRVSTTRPRSHHTEDEIEVVEDPFYTLIGAIAKRDTAEVQALLSVGDINVNRLSKSGKSPLMHAVEQSDEPTLRKLLDPTVGGDVGYTNITKTSALHIAAARGLHAMVKCLLEHDAEIEAKDRRGDTALVKAVQEGQTIVIEYLADSDVDMLTKNIDEWSILHHAVHRPRPRVTSLILNIAPDLRDAVDRAGKTALHYSVEREDLTQVRILLEHPRTALDVNAGDEQERSPLYFAASKPYNARRNEMVCLLLEYQATFIGTKTPPRWKDYPKLKLMKMPASPKQESWQHRSQRHDSFSTSGTIGTTSTEQTRLSRIFSIRSRR